METKQERIFQLIALSVKNKTTPLRNTFAGFIYMVCANRYGFDKRASKPYLETMMISWRTDRWHNYINMNDYLTEEEKRGWFKENG